MSEATNQVVKQIPIENLSEFQFHIFKPYDNKRLERLCQSIKVNNIIHPIIVRKSKKDKDKYEIISGHNRVAAAKLAKLTEVPVVIRELTDDEAKILANEANIESRQWSNWLESEKIKSINQYQDALKSQGIKKIPDSASGGNRQKSEDGYARQRTAAVYGLSPSNVRLYTELSRLVEVLQDKLDKKEFGTTASSNISFISTDGQKLLNSVLDEDEKTHKLTIKNSILLREFFENRVGDGLTKDNEESVKDGVRQILNPIKGDSTAEKSEEMFEIPIPMDTYRELFPDDPSVEEVIEYTIKAIEYRKEEESLMITPITRHT